MTRLCDETELYCMFFWRWKSLHSLTVCTLVDRSSGELLFSGNSHHFWLFHPIDFDISGHQLCSRFKRKLPKLFGQWPFQNECVCMQLLFRVVSSSTKAFPQWNCPDCLFENPVFDKCFFPPLCLIMQFSWIGPDEGFQSTVRPRFVIWSVNI